MLFVHIASLAALAVAAPTERRWFGDHASGSSWWTNPSRASSFIDFGKRYHGRDAASLTCDLSNAVMPTAPTPLPTPASGLSLYHVALGRGTQNYTCDLSNSTAVPAAVGAVATLFNVSCLAADVPDLLKMMGPIALDLPVPNTNDTGSPMYNDMSGHHYFIDDTTPFFNMDTSLHEYGAGPFKKANATSAPDTAPLGQFNKGDGAVAWLKLDAKNAGGQIFQEVYRVHTNGGSPPKTCTGMPASFEVQYSAEYWLYQ